MGGPANEDPALASWRLLADRASATLDQKNYYQLLALAGNADSASIRAAYYKIAVQLHPDRFHGMTDLGVKDRLESVYARVNEAYRVLSNSEKRAQYDKQLAAGKLRFDAKAAEKAKAPRNPEDAIKNADAKRFFRLGMISLARNDAKGAVMNFNFARSYEPDSPVIAEKLADAQAAQKATSGK